MKMEKRYKKLKFFLRFPREREWLEEMALQGYMLEDVKFGTYYSFRKDTPKHMLYEVDRFDLKRNPTLSEMMEKKNFIDMANEVGWKEVTHDESLNYYFTKEYEKDGFNDLYNNEESMQMRADKFRNFYLSQAKLLIKMIAFVATVGLLLDLLLVGSGIDNVKIQQMKMAYHILFGIYIVFTSLFTCLTFKISDMAYEDMQMMSRETWRKQKNRGIRKERHLIITTRGLQKYLKKHAQKGEKLVSMGMLTYTFEKTTNKAVDFVMDTKSMVDERRRKAGMKRISDTKDWNMMGNDWQAESIAYAREHGLECLCAFDNRAIIYQVYDKKDIPEDMEKQRVRLFSIIGGTGMLMLIGGVIGLVLGIVSSMLR